MLYPIVFDGTHSTSILSFCTWILSIFPITVTVLRRACLFDSRVPDIIPATALSVCACHIDFLCKDGATGNIAWHCVNVTLYFLCFKCVPRNNLFIWSSYTEQIPLLRSLERLYSRSVLVTEMTPPPPQLFHHPRMVGSVIKLELSTSLYKRKKPATKPFAFLISVFGLHKSH